MPTHHVYMETKQTSLNYQKKRNMLRKLKWVEMDFSMTKQSCQPQPPLTNRVTRSQAKISANALIIMAKALASTSINSDPLTYTEAMDSPQRDDWKRAMEEECTSILLNNTFTTINSREARQLRVKPIGSKWVYKTKHNPEGTIRYKARLVIKGNNNRTSEKLMPLSENSPPFGISSPWLENMAGTLIISMWSLPFSIPRSMTMISI